MTIAITPKSYGGGVREHRMAYVYRNGTFANKHDERTISEFVMHGAALVLYGGHTIISQKGGTATVSTEI